MVVDAESDVLETVSVKGVPAIASAGAVSVMLSAASADAP
jgi:methylthioribose-1-phosphate isomerase